MNLSWDTLAEAVKCPIRFKRSVDAASKVHQNKAFSLPVQCACVAAYEHLNSKLIGKT